MACYKNLQHGLPTSLSIRANAAILEIEVNRLISIELFRRLSDQIVLRSLHLILPLAATLRCRIPDILIACAKSSKCYQFIALAS